MESDDKFSCCAVSRQQVSTEKLASSISYKQMNRLYNKKALQTNGIYIPEGNFLKGSEDTTSFPTDGEGPVRRVAVNAFYMDEDKRYECGI